MHGFSTKSRPVDLGTSSAHGNLTMHLPRCLALLGGTTRWSDCIEAMRYMLTPAQLVQGAKIEEYEQAFAGTVGVKYAISFASGRSEEHTSELQSRLHLVCRLLLEKKKKVLDRIDQLE